MKTKWSKNLEIIKNLNFIDMNLFHDVLFWNENTIRIQN